ncbi:MAG TPA: hypothetical protein VGR27_03480 [Longimicrobiaceae bacterium]|nr:hypothetical protein [Longimicrobiaceae bacterium]
MAERNEEVFERVREELTKRPNLSTGVLYQMAQGLDPTIGKQNPQQFHTRYVVPIKHEQAAVQRSRKRAGGSRKTKQRQTATPRTRRAAAETQPTTLAPPLVEAQPQPAEPQPAEPAPARHRSPRPAVQPERTTRPRRRENGAGERRRIRAVFLDLAREVAAAESRGEMVEVLRRIDEYIDQVIARQR